MKTIDLTDEQEKALNNLVELTGASDLAELINKSLTLYEFKIKEEKEGRVIASVDRKSKTYTVITI